MQVVKPVMIAPHVTFSSPLQFQSPMDGRGLFNSFMAVAPKHPILKRNFQIQAEYYEGVHKQKEAEEINKSKTHMGTGALFAAYGSLSTSETKRSGGYVLGRDIAAQKYVSTLSETQKCERLLL
jgi:hypothetical protein